MITTTTQFREAVTAVRRVSTPIIAIRTADPASAMAHVTASLNGTHEQVPLLAYDVITGLHGRNSLGQASVTAMLGDSPPQCGPAEAMFLAQKALQDSILFFLNAQRLWEQVDVLQATWNLRDTYKSDGRMLVLIATPGAILPAEIRNDVTVLDEPLPSVGDLEILIRETYDQAELPKPQPTEVSRGVDALIGLASFPAEQVLAVSLSKKGMDVPTLWERKRQAIEQTRGLQVWQGGETFKDIGGCENAKKFMLSVFNGMLPPRVLVFVDEIEKAFAGTGTDLSGVKTELTGTILTWMQDHEADGILALGPPGCAKSAFSKAAASTAGIPTIACDFSAMQSGIVGSSGENLRAALQVIEAVSQGRSLWIATCNSVSSLPTELRRRFKDATFFFDLPNKPERLVIWGIYLEKWKLCSKVPMKGYQPVGPLPDDDGWTGAEIKECCRKAWRLKMTLAGAASYIVPVSISAAEQIENLRRQSSGKFLDAGKPGLYRHQEFAAAVANPSKRRFAAQPE